MVLLKRAIGWRVDTGRRPHDVIRQASSQNVQLAVRFWPNIDMSVADPKRTYVSVQNWPDITQRMRPNPNNTETCIPTRMKGLAQHWLTIAFGEHLLVLQHGTPHVSFLF